MSGSGDDIAIESQVQGGIGCPEILIEVGFLLGQGEAQPFGKDVVMTVAERAVGDFTAHDLA